MAAVRSRLVLQFSVLLLLLAACTNPFFERVKEVVDTAKAKGNPANNINQPPAFSLPGGRIGNMDTIGLTITTPGSHIAYTLDGTDPATNGLGTIARGTAYGSPFTPPYGTFIVKAIAYQAGWGDSAVVSQSYHKDLFLYSLGVSGAGVDVFSLDAATGALSHTSTFGFPAAPAGMAVNSIGTLIFVTAPAVSQVWGFTIDPLTGALTSTGMPGTATNPGAVYVRKSNDALYVADPVGGTIHAWALAATGALTDLGPVSAGSGPVSVVSDSSSLFLYAATSASGGSVYGYNLTPAGTPVVMPTAPFIAAGSPTFVTIDPAGAHLYESDHSTGILRFWNIDSVTGNLTPSFGTPYSVTMAPERMAIDPAGKYLFVTDSVANQVVMARIAADGTLTTGGWVYPTGTAPKGVFVDPSGKFVCVGNSGANTISVFSMDPATGFLTPAGTYLTPSAGPGDILITGTH